MMSDDGHVPKVRLTLSLRLTISSSRWACDTGALKGQPGNLSGTDTRPSRGGTESRCGYRRTGCVEGRDRWARGSREFVVKSGDEATDLHMVVLHEGVQVFQGPRSSLACQKSIREVHGGRK